MIYHPFSQHELISLKGIINIELKLQCNNFCVITLTSVLHLIVGDNETINIIEF
jgi:hypothetical protein